MSAFVWSVRTVAPDGSILDRGDRLRAIRNEGHVTRSLMKARCDRGADIAHKLGFPDATAEAIRALDEHWDGHGQPRGLQGPEIPKLARILCLAQTAEVFHRARGQQSMYRVMRRRSGQWFDPTLVDALRALQPDREFWSSLADADVSAVEPADRVMSADDDRLDRIAEGFAAVIDAKSSWTHEHCDSVGKIATAIAALLGFDEAAVRELRRASLLHDLGKLSISNRILDKPGPLTKAEIERIRQHPLLTEQILGRVASFGQLAAVASAHHERIDGSGYPFGLAGDQLTMPMRVLAVADVYEALVSDRPYRPAYAPRAALDVMRHDVPSGLDADAFAALETLVRRDAGHPELGHLSAERPPLRRVK
jgi:HD-GYP domain-containing protein (c-di-GMP phosphodiesterase class II)